ncbi:MAG: hypothetical protein BMS9Abin26_0876 [Gammaproteobacteria bacterium]|nr:MAG: hypothetical protein BMS9Abin26_0876 [Gammaproteobacteria bacterium]
MRNLLFYQVLLILVLGAASLLWRGLEEGIAASYGGMIAVVNSLLRLWYSYRLKTAGADAGRNIRILYRCALERFLATAGFFALGMGPLTLEPLPLLLGFILVQAIMLTEGFQRK